MRKSKTTFEHINFLVPKEHREQVERIALKEQEDASVIWRRVVRNGLKKEDIKEAL